MQNYLDRPDGHTAANIRAALTLALWSAAWHAGASADRVLTVLAGTGVHAGVRADSDEAAARSGLPGPGEHTASPVELLALLRRAGPAEILLPVPGDVRGLPVGDVHHSPAGDVLTRLALQAGAVVVLPGIEIGLVPVHRQWRALPCGAAHPTLPVREATRAVDDAVVEATRALASADVASSRGNPRRAVQHAIDCDAVTLPPGIPAAASSLLAQATTLAALLSVAAAHPTAAVTSREVGLVHDALAPLSAAVREARRTAVAVTSAALTPAQHSPAYPRRTVDPDRQAR